MKTLIKLAWRNLWRNRRRTFLTAGSVFFAVFFALMMRSMQLGSYDKMIQDVVGAYTGYIQLHANGYWDDRSINNTFDYSDTLKEKLEGVSEITAQVPRLESFALASYTDHSKGVTLIGTIPSAENKLTKIADKVVDGNYLTDDDSGVLVGENIAKYLEMKVGDTIVFIGSGFHGVSAAGKYPIRGIVHFASPELNGIMVIMPLAKTQDFYGAENRLTSVSFSLSSPDQVAGVQEQLLNTVDTAAYEVMAWDEMLVELVQQIESDNAGGILMLGILYIIVAFGMLGTIMMMTAERRKEFGVMVAIGMKKWKLSTIILFETLFIALLGVVAGIVVSLPIVYYYHENPIEFGGEYAKTFEVYGIEPLIPAAWKLSLFTDQGITIFVLAALAALYPMTSILRMKVIKAMNY
ncbi:MAG: FtsX-like permease family protein [Bacteroidetes bacterium]|nr:FtsX-like permease family protein [Bacteroidota bacterium]MBU1719631.1 FtsX-like permease family protein [Bacteroidota bacterium]